MQYVGQKAILNSMLQFLALPATVSLVSTEMQDNYYWELKY